MVVPQQKLNIELPYGPVIPLLGYKPKGIASRCFYTHVYKSISHHSQKVEMTGPSADTYNGISFSLKRSEILTHAATEMNLEDTIQSDLRQIQKDKYCMIPLR